MGRIVGIFNRDRRPITLSDVQALGAASTSPRSEGEDFWICGSFGIGHQYSRVTPESLTERQPLVSVSGTAISFDGRLDNREDLFRLRRAHRLESEDSCSDAALILAAYERFGEAFASELNGDFALALFDSRRRQLFLARDVMGARPLHYCPLPGAVVFASQIASLLEHPGVSTCPDEDGIADLVLDKWDDGHHTCFKGIYSVPPGHVVAATIDALTLRRHWAFDPAREIRYRSADEYAECFRSLFEDAICRRLRSARSVAVSVSGGVDSSAIFCQAAALRQRGAASAAVHGISMAFPAGTAADEREFLDEIDLVYNTRIRRLPVSELRLLADADNVVGHLEMPGVFWDAYGDVTAAARGMECSVLLDGYFGDQMLFGRHYLVDLARRGRWRKVHHDLRQFSEWMTDAAGFFWPDFRAAFLRSLAPRWLFEAAKKRATGWRLARYPACYARPLLDRLLDRQMSRYETRLRFASRHAEEYYRQATAGHDLVHVEQQSRIGLMHGVQVCHPFRDRDLVAFLMAIPGEAVNREGIPKGLLRRALGSILPEAIRNRRWKADFTAFHLQAVLREYTAMAHLLTRDCLSVRAGFVDGNLVERDVEKLKKQIVRAGDTMAAWQLTSLASLEIWLRHFFQDRFGPPAECTTS